MVKLIIFFRKPADTDAFEEHFAHRHVPLVAAMPNVVRSSVSRAIGAPRGEAPYYLIHDVYFADMAALNFALNSAEGRAAGADLSVFARDVVSLMFAEVWGEDPFEMNMEATGSEPVPNETATDVKHGSMVQPAQSAQPTQLGQPATEAVPPGRESKDEESNIDATAQTNDNTGRVPIDVSFLEKPRDVAPELVPETIAVTNESSVCSSQSPVAPTTQTDTPVPELDAERPPKPSLGETQA